MTLKIRLRYKDEWTTSPLRDMQKSKVYHAEFACRKRFPNEKTFESIEEAQKFVDKVLASATYDKLCERFDCYRRRTIKVVAGRNSDRDSARYYPDGTIKLPPWALNKCVVLHELAHSVSPRFEHNWPFCEIFLALIGRFMGAADRDMLKAEYKKRKVKFRKPRKVSDEQRAAMADRARKNFGHRESDQ